jgi:hypothetical protein
MILKNIVYEVLTELRQLSDDGYTTEAFVEQLIDVYRAKYIQQEYSKRNMVSQTSIQSFNLKLAVVDSSSDDTVTTDVVILESDVLPSLITLSKRSGIIRIRSIDEVKGEINFMSVDRAKLSTYSKFPVLNAYLGANNKLYVVGNQASSILIRNINVDAVLGTPKSISGYTGKGRIVGADFSDYPMDPGMWNYVKQDVIEHILMSYRVPSDKANNSIDDTEGQGNVKGAR